MVTSGCAEQRAQHFSPDVATRAGDGCGDRAHLSTLQILSDAFSDSVGAELHGRGVERLFLVARRRPDWPRSSWRHPRAAHRRACRSRRAPGPDRAVGPRRARASPASRRCRGCASSAGRCDRSGRMPRSRCAPSRASPGGTRSRSPACRGSSSPRPAAAAASRRRRRPRRSSAARTRAASSPAGRATGLRTSAGRVDDRAAWKLAIVSSLWIALTSRSYAMCSRAMPGAS